MNAPSTASAADNTKTSDGDGTISHQLALFTDGLSLGDVPASVVERA